MSIVYFTGSGSAGTGTYVVTSSNPFYFEDYSTAGQADMFVYSSGVIVFQGHSTAGQAALTTSSCPIYFKDESSAGSADITVSGSTYLYMLDSSNAGGAHITMTDGSYLTFQSSSSAVGAIINLDDATLYAGDNSTLSDAVVSATNGSTVAFAGQSTSLNARFYADASSTVDFSGSSGQGGQGVMTACALQGRGTYEIGRNILEIGLVNDGGADPVSGVVTDMGGSGYRGGQLATYNTVDASALTIGGTASWINAGTAVQTGAIAVGDSSNGAALLRNADNATFDVAGDWSVAAGTNAASTFDNDGGLLLKSSGTGVSTLWTSFTDSEGLAGQIMVLSGALQLRGANTSLVDQTITGAGTFWLAGQAATIGGGTTIASGVFAVGAGVTVTLGQALSYTGQFSDTDGSTLALGGNMLTLGGSAIFHGTSSGVPAVTGSGKLISNGTTYIDALTVGGSVVLRDNGTVVQSGSMTLGDSANGAATITIAGTWQIAGDVSIAAGSTAASIGFASNATSQLLLKTAGSTTRSVVSPNIVNNGAGTGIIRVATGKLELGGTLTGNIALKGNTGTTLILDKAASAGTVASYVQPGFTLQLNDGEDYHGSITGFGTGENLDLRSILDGGSYTPTLAYGGNGSTGTLTVSDGSRTAHLAMVGNFAANAFHLGADGHGGSLITYGGGSA